MNVKSFALEADISPSLVYELCKLGVIPCTRHGRPGRRGCIRIPEDALPAYLESCKRVGATIESASPLSKHLKPR